MDKAALDAIKDHAKDLRAAHFSLGNTAGGSVSQSINLSDY